MRANLLTVNMTSFGDNALPFTFFISIVARPTSPVRSERLWTSVERRDIAAKQRATTSLGSSYSSNSAAAETLKYAAVSSGIPLQAIADVLAAAARTASTDGGPTRSNLKPWPKSRSMRTMSLACLLLKRSTDTPFPFDLNGAHMYQHLEVGQTE
jgi:hypothetical protein